MRASEGKIVFEMESETFFNFLHALTKADFNAELAGFRKEAFDDGGRRIGDGKHPAVRFCFELDAAGLEPFDGIARLKSVKRAEKFFFAAGIVFYQEFRIEAGMSNVAAASSGDFDFGKENGSFF